MINSQTLVHILESGLQDSTSVVSVMEHVLKSLKKQHPGMTDVYFRQDNAGCYHCANTILSCNSLSERPGSGSDKLTSATHREGRGPVTERRLKSNLM